jgi:pimeloyl-ACP methyl ester carboxylesterase
LNKLPLIIIHGWSDDSNSFNGLAEWLRGKGYKVIDLWLADYISSTDDVTLPDLGLAMRRALEANRIAQTRHSFDVVVHSTGGLVVREYLRQICAGDENLTPIKRCVMLAPANFGSPLASLGKSMIGRIFKGWNPTSGNFLQSGKRVLEALELASPYSFDLAVQDLFTPEYNLFHPSHTMATVLAGTVPYPDALKAAIHENGSDGTVRVATANLNAV